MKRRPTLPYLLLLPVLAVLLFGNCGGEVRGVVNGMSRMHHDRFQDIFAQHQAQRALARQRLHGRADSFFRFKSHVKEKFDQRHHKMTRQLLAPDNRMPVDTR